jgi:hypothetical protein
VPGALTLLVARAVAAGYLAVAITAGSLGCASTQGDPHRVHVEPTRRLTFGPAVEVPPGTAFHILVVSAAPHATILLNRCGVPCNTTTLVAFWFSHGYAAGDVLTRSVDYGGTYYLWIRDHRTNEASAVLSDEVAGTRLRMTFDSGAVLEAWYVTP